MGILLEHLHSNVLFFIQSFIRFLYEHCGFRDKISSSLFVHISGG